jgi:hypothetical protein
VATKANDWDAHWDHFDAAALVADVTTTEQGEAGSLLARAAMAAFDPLFRLNLPGTPFGWQTYAVAYPVTGP